MTCLISPIYLLRTALLTFSLLMLTGGVETGVRLNASFKNVGSDYRQITVTTPDGNNLRGEYSTLKAATITFIFKHGQQNTQNTKHPINEQPMANIV